MLHRSRLCFFALVATCFTAAPSFAETAAGSVSARPLITQPVDSGDRALLHSEAAWDVSRSQATGLLDQGRELALTVVLARSPEQQAALDMMHSHAQSGALSPAAFAESFGASRQDFAAVAAWLAGSGFTVSAQDAVKNTITVRGTVAEVEAAFAVSLHTYTTPEGHEFFSASGDPGVPAAIAPAVVRVRGLQNLYADSDSRSDVLLPRTPVVAAVASAVVTGAVGSSPAFVSLEAPSTIVTVTLAWKANEAPTGSLTLNGPQGTRGSGELAQMTLANCAADSAAHTTACLMQVNDAYSALPGVGSNRIEADYSGDKTYAAATVAGAIVVSKGSVASSTTLTAGASPSVSYGAGTTESWSVNVTGAAGDGKPAGTITVSQSTLGTLDTATVSTTCTYTGAVGSRVYTCPATGSYAVSATAAAGTYSNLTFSYGGSGTYAASSATTSLTITADATSTALSANPATILPTSSTSITATVTNTTVASATPAGKVAFALGSASLGSCTLSSGACSVTVNGSSLATGSNSITSTYTPSPANWTTSTGSTTVTVAQDATTTSVTAAPGSISVPGQTTLTATVTDATNPSLTVTGTVDFEIGTTVLNHCTLSGGTCSHVTAARKFSAGSNTVTAVYVASTDWSTSSGTTTVDVTPATSTTKLAASPASINKTESSTITATVTSRAKKLLAGSVAFSTGSTSLGSCTISSETCSVTIAAGTLPPGSYTITGAFTSSTSDITNSSGTTGLAVNADLVFSSVTHNFGSWAVNGGGTTGTSQYGVHLTNYSSSTEVFTVSLSGSDEFALTGNTCAANLTGGSLTEGSSCELVFSFSPTELGAASATWSLTGVTPSGTTFGPSNGGTLSGTGIAANAVSITTNGHDFGIIAVEASSPVFGAVLTNGTASAVTLTVGATTAPFTVYLNNCPASLAAGASCNLQWTFDPTTTGTVSENVPLTASSPILFGSTAVTSMYLAGTGQ